MKSAFRLVHAIPGLASLLTARLALLTAAILLLAAAPFARAQSHIVLEQPAGNELVSNRLSFSNAETTVETPSNVPPNLPAITNIVAADRCIMALLIDGTVASWGQFSPGVPAGLTGVRSISTSNGISVAVKNDGTLVLWGDVFHELTPPPGLGPVKQAVVVCDGGEFVVALKSDGTLATWGSGPFVPADVHDVVAITAGFDSITALKGNGTIESWGFSLAPHVNNFTEAAVRTYGPFYEKPVRFFRPSVGDAYVAGGYETGGFFLIRGTEPNMQNYYTESNPRLVDYAFSQQYFNPGPPQSQGTIISLTSDTRVDAPSIPSINGLAQTLAVAAGPQYTVALRGSTVAFGEQPVGLPDAVKTFTIKNTGLAPLVISSVQVTGAQAADFMVDTAGLPGSVPPGSQGTFTVTFHPGARGDRVTTLRVVSNDPVESPMVIALTGTSGSPDISVAGNGVEILNGDPSPSLADHTEFANANRTNGTSVRTYTVANSGTAPLTILPGDIYFDGGSSADFAVGGITLPSNIVPGGSTTFTVTFNPSDRGLLSTSVVIRSNDSHDSLYTFKIRGLSVPEVSLEQPAGVPLLSNRVLRWASFSDSFDVTGVKAISAGLQGGTYAALKYDGSVMSNFSSLVVQAPLLAGAQTIAIGSNWGIALKKDGTVADWGAANRPILPAGLTGVKSIAAYDNTGVAVKSDGTIVVWGEVPPNPPATLTGVKDAAVGEKFIVALKDDGTVVAWGKNNAGQLNVPPGLTGVKAVAAGTVHGLALKNDGTVVGWGSDFNGSSGEQNAPAGLTDVKAIYAGVYTSAALKNDGTLIQWGACRIDIAFGLSGVQAAKVNSSISYALRSSTVDFGGQAVGSASGSRTFTIKNTGSVPLNISGVTAQDAEAADFTVNTAGTLTTLPPFTGQTTFSVTFHPGGAGERFTTLRVATDAPDGPETTDNPYIVVLTGTGLSSLEAWRQTYFGDPANSGNGADTFDFEHDGIVNLLEYAFGLDPTQRSQFPQPQLGGGNFYYSFTQPASVGGITYSAESSATLLPGSWSPIPDTGILPQHVFSLPLGGPKNFMRLKVTNP